MNQKLTLVPDFEGSAQELEIDWLNDAQESVPFGSLRYRVDCLSNNRTLRDWTEIESPTVPYSLSITSDDLQLIDRQNTTEMRAVTIQADFGTASQKVKEVRIPILKRASE